MKFILFLHFQTQNLKKKQKNNKITSDIYDRRFLPVFPWPRHNFSVTVHRSNVLSVYFREKSTLFDSLWLGFSPNTEFNFKFLNQIFFVCLLGCSLFIIECCDVLRCKTQHLYIIVVGFSVFEKNILLYNGFNWVKKVFCFFLSNLMKSQRLERGLVEWFPHFQENWQLQS